MGEASRLHRPSFLQVYVRRSCSRNVASSSAGAGEELQPTAGQSSVPIPTPVSLRRSTRAKPMKRKTMTPPVKCLKNRQQTKVGSECRTRQLDLKSTRRGGGFKKRRRGLATPDHDERIESAGAPCFNRSRPISDDSGAGIRMSRTEKKPIRRRMVDNQVSISPHNDAPSSSNCTTPHKAERIPRSRRKPWKSLIRLKVMKDKPTLKATKKNGGESNKRGKKRKMRLVHNQRGTEQMAIVPSQNAPTDPSSSSAMVHLPLVAKAGRGHQRQRMRVDLDDDTLRVYDALIQWEKTDSESFEGVDIGSGPGWNKTRQDFEKLVDDFISAVRDLLGPRQFSPCEGSVIDSVVGTFLTQNAADHLSSDAFMNLAAKYPARKSRNSSENCSNVPLLTYARKSSFKLNKVSDVTNFDSSAFAESVYYDEEINYGDEVKGNHDEDYEIFMENFVSSMKEQDPSIWTNEYLSNLVKDKPENKTCSLDTLKRLIATLRVEDTSHWDKLRDEACRKGYRSDTKISDLVDWEAVLNASPIEVAKCIAVRGMNYVIACRIQAFLLRTKKDHGSFDLDWLRYVPRESAKNYLLSIHGLGYKSVDCIRLLSLEHKAFPVDVNICRICIRLGWVKLHGIPDSVAFHLIDLYPILSDVQKYLWPRLCTIVKKILYELHCLIITFGKVVCTKVNPNCSACPLRPKCKYYNSLLNRASLPPSKKHVYEPGKDETSMATSSNDSRTSNSLQVYQHQMDLSRTTKNQPIRNCEPVIEEPPSPVYEHIEENNEQDQAFQDDLSDMEDYYRPEGSQFDAEIDLCSHNHMLNHGSWIGNHGKDMVLSHTQATFGRQKKLKNIGRLRTEHHAYVLQDDHIILKQFEHRHKADPHPYLLVISSTDEHTVKGTILIPFRTALRGNFPLKGTYFQDHEVFADYSSSRHPMTIPRNYIWDLKRCVVYFGSSIQSITKDMTEHGIQECYKEGYVCVRCFDRQTGYPRQLCASLHATNEPKENVRSYTKKPKTSSQGKDDQKASPVGHGDTTVAGLRPIRERKRNAKYLDPTG